MIWNYLSKYRDEGLLLLRVVVGLYLAIAHGWGKIGGGPEQWANLGGVMEPIFGIGFAAAFWGFIAAFAEFFCALFVVVGFLFRPSLLLLVLHFLVVSLAHISGVIDGGPEMAVLYGVVFLSLFFTGPGTYSLDKQIWGERSQVAHQGV